MTGGILQLVARGYDDTFIIKEPEITYFKIVYRRHTNFSTFPKLLNFSENLNFGKIGKCRIKYLGDLLYKMYLVIDIPEIDITNNYYTVNDLVNLLKSYDIFIGNYNINTNLEISFLDNIIPIIRDNINILYNNYLLENNKKNKNSLLNKLKKIGFCNNNNWYFPDSCNFLKSTFKHNELTEKIYVLFNEKPKFAWIKELAHYLIEYIEINIDGVNIDTHNSEIIRSDKIINLENEKLRGYNEMIGNLEELYSYNSNIKHAKKLYLPLGFWFCRHISSAIPLVAMPHSNIDIIVKFRDFNEVTYCPNVKFKTQPKLNASLIAHYVYIEEQERKRICENKQEYLIEKFETSYEEIYGAKDLIETKETIEDKNNNFTFKESKVDYKLHFHYTTKQLFWIVKPYKNNNNFDKFDYTFYDINNKPFNPISNMKIKFNGRDRETLHDFNFYQYWQPYKHHCSSLVDNLFLYNFALYPQMLQPSGCANFGKLSEASFNLHLNNKLTNLVENNNFKFKVSCYALQYNILRIFSGMAGLAFTY